MNRLYRVFATALLVVTAYHPTSGEQIMDDFSDGVLGPDWEVVTQTGNTFWEEANGVLNIGGSSGQTGELVIKHNQPLANVGSVRFDYEWLSCDGHKARAGLAVYDSFGENGFLIKGVKHAGNCNQHAVDGNHHVVDGDGQYEYIEPVPESGSFMIERADSNFRVRYLNGDEWLDLIEANHDFGGEPIYPYVFTSNSHSNPNWHVAMDNFTADVIVQPLNGLTPNGVLGDDLLSIVYDPASGELSVDAPRDTELSSIDVHSDACVFTGESACFVSFDAPAGGSFGSISFGNAIQPGLVHDLVLEDLKVEAIQSSGEVVDTADLVFLHELVPGDSNRDFNFNQADILQVIIQGSKYLTGEPATWGEGDWDGAPGGYPGEPPAGNGLFDQQDIISALSAGAYLSGPYAASDNQLVPEPSTFLLLCLGMSGIILWRRRSNL